MVNDIAVQEFVNAIKEEPVNTNTTYSATVSHVDDEGIVWVNLYGSDKQTPTASTSSEVKSGDKVTVNWRNNKLYIGGNYSNPSAGVTTVNRVEGVANNAQATADVAFTAANNAVADAERAHAAADEAEGHAQTALTNAGIAQTAAESAQTSADSALVSLATVEDVVGVLNWITAHGTMTANGSTALDPSKVYFIRDNNGDYTVGSYNYSIVSEPKAEDRTSYYTLSVDESVQNYVATHVTVNSEGMWLIPDQNGTPTTNGKKILIATGAGSTYTTAGTYIIDRSNGTDIVVAVFGADGARIGAENSSNLVLTDDGIAATASAGYEYFEVSEEGSVLSESKTFTLNSTPIIGGRSINLSTETKTESAWQALSTGSTFKVKVKYFYRRKRTQDGVGELRQYDTETVAFTKGTTDTSNSYVGYNSTNVITIKSAYPSMPAVTTTYPYREYAGNTVDVILVAATATPFYRFGGETAESGGAYGFEAGYGTNATGDYSMSIGKGTIAYGYQLAMGRYNEATSGAFVIGHGTDDNNRSNVFNVGWYGDVSASGEITDGNGKTVSKAYCFCTGITTTSVTTQNTDTKVPISSIDIAKDFTYDSTNKGVKCGKAGRYFVSVWLVTSTATAGDLMGVVVNKNNSAATGDPTYHRLNGSYDNIQLPPTYMSLAENDVLTLSIRNNSSGRGTVTGCRFAIWEVG